MYNAEEFIGNCIESLLRQNIPEHDYEIIIMDDGSSDSSIAIVNDFTLKHQNIKLYAESNVGAYSTRNKLLKLAKGDYIYNLDADDYLVDNCLGSLIKIAEDHSLDLIGFETKETTQLNQSELHNPIKNSDVELSSGSSFISNHRYLRHEIWWYFIRREFIEHHNMTFNQNEYNADVVFTLEALLKSDKIGYLPLSIHRYVQTPNSLMRSQQFEILAERMMYLQMMILDKSKLINSINIEFASTEDKLIDNLTYRRDVFTFFNILNIYRNPFSVSYLKKHIASYKSVQAFPIKNFIGKEYHSVAYKSLLFFVNRPFLIYPFLRLKNVFVKPKL